MYTLEPDTPPTRVLASRPPLAIRRILQSSAVLPFPIGFDEP